MAKYLGIDYGIKRIGIALSDDEGTFAFPKMIIVPDELEKTLQSLIAEAPLEAIVIGNSVASNGVENSIALRIQSVAKKLEQYAPVFLQDEGFSSFEAHRYQTDAGSRDDSAAAIILQRFLDKKKK